LQTNKERNIHSAIARIDGLVVRPHELFSHHWTVGRPSFLRGFRWGLELHNEEPATGLGGGICKVSNLLYLLSLLAGMKIVERHRHALDLFPDKERTVPFGCGATVFYNYADFRFENPLPVAVLIGLTIQERELVGEIRAVSHPGWQAEIYETNHRFRHDKSGWLRENCIRRKFTRNDGEVLRDEVVAHNRARVLYQPHIPLPQPVEVEPKEIALCCAP